MHWNLSVQHQFTNNLSLLVGYVGDKSIHNAFHFDDFNVIFPNLSSGVPLWQCGTLASPPGPGFDPTTQCPLFPNSANLKGPNAALIAPHINCCIGREPGRIWNGFGFYNGLQVALNKAVGHGLSFQGSYTWSKNMDTSSGTSIGDPYVNSISSSLYYWNNKLRYGLSDTNIEHNLVISYTYLLPTPASGPGVLKVIAGGWQTGGILTIQSGQPMTALILGDAIGEGNTDAISYPDRICSGSLVNPGNVQNYLKLQCFAHTTPVLYQGSYWLTGGNEGRNSIIGPGLGTLDFSLFKNNYVKRISESFNAQFRFEAFNVFNRPNFSPPTDNYYLYDTQGHPIPGAGAIDLTTTTSRQLQAAIKIIF